MLSSTAEYALRVAVYLAVHADCRPTRKEIAVASGIPVAYLVKVLRKLELSQLIQSKRGPGGGYSLTKEPGEISAFDVISAVAEIPRIKKCPLGLSNHLRLCPLHARLDSVARLAEEA